MKSADLKKKLDEGEDVLVLDVRETDEYEAGDNPIKGAQNMPMGKVFREAAHGTLPKDTKIVAVCKSGSRCEIVARELQQKGYDIEHLEGGLSTWQD